jgi:hypothetical protein
MGKYSGWLLRHVRGIGRATSAISGKPLSVPLYSAFQAMPEGRLIGAEEAKEAGRQLRISNDEAETFSLGNAREKLGRIAYFCVEREIGNNTNNIDCPVQINSSGCYRIPNCVFTKDSAYSYWARNSEHCFGCSRVFDSAFCISCHNSMKLSRCFEMDCCRNCADSYFCHNCENVHDSMFCFNVKNLRYAIGNAEVGREAFERAKKLLLAEITGSLEKTHDYKRSIYNISGKGN